MRSAAGGRRHEKYSAWLRRCKKIPREAGGGAKKSALLEDLRGKNLRRAKHRAAVFWLQTMIALDQLGIDPEKL